MKIPGSKSPYWARVILTSLSIGIDQDFDTLYLSQVEGLLTFADQDNYRAPRNANGSRARYYLARIQRLAAKGKNTQ